jgi:DNA-binding transcriptional LysR family regulator
LRITAAPDAGELLSNVVVSFAARYPSVCVQVELSTRVVNLVAEGFDAGLRAALRLRDAAVMARLLARTELQLFASPTYVARRGMPAQVDELGRHECVLFRAQNQHAEWRLQGPEGARKVRVAGRIDCNEFPFVRAALVAGAGIGHLPGFFARDDVAAGRLVRVLPQWATAGGGLYFVYPRARHVPKRVLAFRDILIENLQGKLG